MMNTIIIRLKIFIKFKQHQERINKELGLPTEPSGHGGLIHKR